MIDLGWSDTDVASLCKLPGLEAPTDVVVFVTHLNARANGADILAVSDASVIDSNAVVGSDASVILTVTTPMEPVAPTAT